MDAHYSTLVGPTFGKAKEKINNNTRKCTNFCDLAEPYRLFKKLKTPARPRLDELDFYQGQRLPESCCYLELRGAVQNVEDRAPKSLVQLEELLLSFKQGHITFVGPAGSGKTTLLKSIAINVLEGNFEGLEDVEIVCYLQCAGFRRDELVSAAELLFHSTEEPLTSTERDVFLTFATKFPERILFVLDSLDSLRFTVDGVYKVTEIHELACPEAILSNFLSGNLFHGCRIITSSREHAIRNFKGDVRPNKVVALVGLSMESIKAILVGYVGKKEAEEILEHLRTKAPAQLSLCTTPVLLVYTLIGLKSDRSFDPTTMSGILSIVFQSLLRSAHVRQGNILDILRKLQHLACKGTMEGRIIFSVEELEEMGILPEEATDLAILAPGGFSQKILRGSSHLFFSHLSLQEMLVSLNIARFDMKTYDHVLENNLHTPRFFVVRRFLCGILCDKEVYGETQDLLEDTSDIPEKRSKLKQSLRDQLLHTDRGPDFLELLLSLHEAKDGATDLIRQNLHKIDLEDLPLSTSDIYVVGSVIARCIQLSEVDLQNCNLVADSIKYLSSLLDGSDVKVSQLWLGRNTNLGEEGMTAVGEITMNHSVDKLHFFQCNLQRKQLLALRSALGSTQVSLLDLSGNQCMGVDGIVAARQIAENCGVEHFDLQKCRLSSDQLDAFVKFSPGAKVKILRLNENMSATHENVVAVSKLLPHVTGTLSLCGWKVNPSDIVFLQQELDKQENERLIVRFKDFSMTSSQGPAPSSTLSATPCHEDNQAFSLRKPKAGDEESEEIIGTEGGTMKVGICRVIFQPGSLSKPELMQVIVTEAPIVCPENYFAVAPLITCEPAVKFNSPVTLKLPPWCSTESDDVIVYVMTKEKRGDVYNPIDQMKLKDCREYITFRVNHFSPFWALVERIFLGKVKYMIKISLYYNAEGNFTIILHSGNGPAIDHTMEMQNFHKAPVFFDERAIYLDEMLSLSLGFRDPEGTSFSPDELKEFCLGCDFESSRQKHLQLVMNGLPEPGTLLKLNASFKHTDEASSIPFNIRWPDWKPAKAETPMQVTNKLTFFKVGQIIDKRVNDNSVHIRDVVADTLAAGPATVQIDDRNFACDDDLTQDREDDVD